MTTPAPKRDIQKPKSFQEIILKLSAYWSSKGCAILQPYDMEVGAGTLHPATTLRALGPKPWYAAYPQPSRRPKDGRYGENPNRLQHYYQYQVILKPDPGNPQEMYLRSLEALGISPLTVKNHIQNILRKLNVHSKLEAVVFAYQNQLI